MGKIKYKEGSLLETYKVPKDIIEIDESRMGEVKGDSSELYFDGKPLYINVRGGGVFADRALYLSQHYDWVLCTDALDGICLVPLKKETE